MKKKYWFLLNCFILLSVLVVSMVVKADNVDAVDGGEAPVQGEITLVGDSSTEPPNSSGSEPSESSDSKKPPLEKPKGRFPSTGEIVKTGFSVGGISLILIVFYLLKRNRARSNEKGE